MKTTQTKTETKPGHTPGPWINRNSDHEPSAGKVWIVKDGQGKVPLICRVSDGNPSAEDNARLIAAAPELLAACEFGVKLCVAMAKDADPHIDLKRGESADFDAACDALDIFRAAISAAKGCQ